MSLTGNRPTVLPSSWRQYNVSSSLIHPPVKRTLWIMLLYTVLLQDTWKQKKKLKFSWDIEAEARSQRVKSNEERKRKFVTRLCGDEIQEGERKTPGGRKKRMKFSEKMDERKQNGMKEKIRLGKMEASTVSEIFLITGFSVIKCISLLLHTLGWQRTAEVVSDIPGYKQLFDDIHFYRVENRSCSTVIRRTPPASERADSLA